MLCVFGFNCFTLPAVDCIEIIGKEEKFKSELFVVEKLWEIFDWSIVFMFEFILA